MHELALTQGIVDLVTQVGRQEGLHRVTRVVVEVGVAAAVVPDALTFCFDIVAADTIARGAELVIEPVALRAVCRACGDEFDAASLASPCPDCGAYGPRLVRGRELRVKSLDGE
ncbi:MAG TPA: hydrogenase maturation nickel metallochaperone HypA [Burkholderiales bacterium]|nr:hydrogenase maturation nickel metallochaperone HypA [Burkholderiales bacterium]